MTTSTGLDKMDFDQCDDCYLGPLAMQISSPISVADHTVSLFEKVKAACPNAEYNVAVAKSWKARIAAATKEGTEYRARYDAVKKGDTCTGISLSQNSSTVKLIQYNADYKPMPDEDTKLCLAETYEAHEILEVAVAYGVSTR